MVARKNTKKLAKPAKKVAAKPSKKPAAKPARKVAAKPGKKPAAKPARKQVKKAAAKAVAQPKQAAKPAAKKTAAPAKTPTAAAPAKKKPVAAVVAAKPIISTKPAAPTAPKQPAVSVKKPVHIPPVKVADKGPAPKPFNAKSPGPHGGVVKTESPNGKQSAAFVLKQQQRLLDLRDELINAMHGVTRDTLRNAPEGSEASGSGMHQGDAGSDAYDRDFALSVLAKEQDALYEIEEALKRIKRGTYGVCEMSGRRIPQARLEAIPFARLTVECQAEWEREHGNRRFRPSGEVGFGGGIYEEEDESESVSLDEEEEQV